jgi:hypothetical protein
LQHKHAKSTLLTLCHRCATSVSGQMPLYSLDCRPTAIYIF